MLKIFIKKIAKIFGGLKKVSYFCAWRDGRVVDCGGLENRCAARHRGFESLSLRSDRDLISLIITSWVFFLFSL